MMRWAAIQAIATSSIGDGGPTGFLAAVSGSASREERRLAGILWSS